jgi:endonuclease I
MKIRFILYTFILLTLHVAAQPPQGYYSSALNKSGATLKTSLYGIISSGYVDKGYDFLYEIYKTSDNTAGGKVWDMYSTCTWSHGVKKCGNYQIVCDCYNREHSIPQSWFNSSSPMVSDAFHVYPTDGKVNGQRSNYPFGECSGGTTLTNGKGRSGNSTYPGYSNTVFEPVDEYKGDFARTYFYFATRYENIMTSIDGDSFNGTKFPAFTTWTKEMFMKWHRQDPVSQKEITRNNAIYVYQKNRNPFIDHPELAEYLWGNLAGTPWSLTTVNTPAELLVKFYFNINEKEITMTTQSSPVKYRILNISGQIVNTGTVDQQRKISLAALNSGMYLVQFEWNEIKAVKKIVIK